MKTVMQELKERLILIGLSGVDEFIDEYIEKEKKQIEDIVDEVLQDANLYESFRSIESGEKYYTNNFTP